MILYDVKTILALLRTHDIGTGPRIPEEAQQHCYVYPPATQFPRNSLIRDTIEYFIGVKGDVNDRRVGFLIQSVDERLLALVINLTGVNHALAQQLKTSLTDANVVQQIDTILRDPDLSQQFRQLYANVQCVLLGLNPL